MFVGQNPHPSDLLYRQNCENQFAQEVTICLGHLLAQQAHGSLVDSCLKLKSSKSISWPQKEMHLFPGLRAKGLPLLRGVWKELNETYMQFFLKKVSVLPIYWYCKQQLDHQNI